MKKKLALLYFIIIFIFEISNDFLYYFRDSKPVNDSISPDHIEIRLLVILVLCLLGALVFFIGALFYKMNPFSKRLTIIIAVTALNFAMTILFGLLELSILYPIITGSYVILLIYSIKLLIGLFSKNKQKATNTEVNE